MLKEKIWKPIKNYEDYYEINNYGVVRRIKYDNIGNLYQHQLPNYIKPRYDKDGYMRYDLSLNNKVKRYMAHRLVADVFIPNPNNLPCVNHKDGNKKNNYVDNLEWCSVRHNNIHALKTGLRNMKNNKLSKPVEQYDLNNNLMMVFKSANDASRILNISQGHISECCRGEIKNYKGYIWKYKVK